MEEIPVGVKLLLRLMYVLTPSLKIIMPCKQKLP